jgi:phage shock protein A
MAGLVSRLKRITVSRVSAFLETVEEPEAIFPQLIREMQDKVGEALNAESKAAAALAASQRRLDESTGRSIRLTKGAELALRYGDESLAREALAEQIRTDRFREDLEHTLKQSEAALRDARELRLHLQAQLEELKNRKREILARSRSVKSTAGTYGRTDRIKAAGTAILDEVSRLEQKEEASRMDFGQTRVSTVMFEYSLEDRLRSLEQEAEIERRLDSIREKKRLKRTRED